jgi:hypothetical protein
LEYTEFPIYPNAEKATDVSGKGLHSLRPMFLKRHGPFPVPSDLKGEVGLQIFVDPCSLRLVNSEEIKRNRFWNNRLYEYEGGKQKNGYSGIRKIDQGEAFGTAVEEEGCF